MISKLRDFKGACQQNAPTGSIPLIEKVFLTVYVEQEQIAIGYKPAKQGLAVITLQYLFYANKFYSKPLYLFQPW